MTLQLYVIKLSNHGCNRHGNGFKIGPVHFVRSYFNFDSFIKVFLEKKKNKFWNKVLDNNIQNDAEHYLLIIASTYGFSCVGLGNNKKNYKVHVSFLSFLWY